MPSTPDTQLRQQHATRAAFFVPGFAIACWGPLVPFVKARAGLDDATLGMVLLCLGLGSLVAMPLSGLLAARHGCRPVMLSTVVMMVLSLPLLALAATPLTIALVLLAFGAAIGAMDCVMNIQAVAVERESGRSMMSGFHAFYSIGSLVGAAGMTLLLSAGASALTATCAIAIGTALVTASSIRYWRSERAVQQGPALALPRGIVIAIGAVCFVTFLAEGSMLDWSALLLHEVRGVDVAHAGWGFVAFNLAMTLTRLLGDRVVDRLGHARAVLAGGLLACAGFLLATLAPRLELALAGYTLVGIGCANIVPVMFTLAGRQTRMPESIAIPAVTTMGYAGVLLGPAAIGFVAQHWSLPGAFILVTAALAGATFIGSTLRVR
jgi:predicted MFS family arabinose efflux permease